MTSNGVVPKRDSFYDVAKGIGIVFVILGHSVVSGGILSRMIHSFHMPLFLYISGVFFGRKNLKHGRDAMVRVVWGLLFPYVVFGILATVLTCDVQLPEWVRHPMGKLIVCAHGEFGTTSLWFLMCLASVQWLSLILPSPRVHRIVWMPVIALILICVAQFIHVACPVAWIDRMPFMLLSVPCCAVFFWIGMCCGRMPIPCACRCLVHYFERRRLFLVMCVAVAIVLLFLLCKGQKLTFDLRRAVFDVRVLLPCLCGFVIVFASAVFFGTLPVFGRALSFIGRYSLCFFALEFPVWHVVCRVLHWWGVAVVERAMRVEQSPWDVCFRVGVLLVLLSLVAMPVMNFVERIRTRAKIYLAISQDKARKE